MSKVKMTIFIIIGLVLLLVFVLLASLTRADRIVLLGKPETLTWEDKNRSYRIYVPENISQNPKLILVFHGFSSDSRQIAYVTGMHNSTDSNTIVVYPEAVEPTNIGLKKGWNAGYCCGSGWVEKIDDIGYIDALLDKLSSEYDISPENTHATGFSNGAMFVHRLAEELPDRINGFAAVAGSLGANGQQHSHETPKPMLLMHGEKDIIIPFNGGAGGSDQSFNWISFPDTKQAWETTNQAKDPTTTENSETHLTTYGSNKQPLRVLTYKNIGHIWPDWRLVNPLHHETDGSKKVVEFFDSLK